MKIPQGLARQSNRLKQLRTAREDFFFLLEKPGIRATS
jgi:hypothetical protein